MYVCINSKRLKTCLPILEIHFLLSGYCLEMALWNWQIVLEGRGGNDCQHSTKPNTDKVKIMTTLEPVNLVMSTAGRITPQNRRVSEGKPNITCPLTTRPALKLLRNLAFLATRSQWQTHIYGLLENYNEVKLVAIDKGFWWGYFRDINSVIDHYMMN